MKKNKLHLESNFAIRTECILRFIPLKMNLIQLVKLLGIVGNTLVVNDVFIVHYFNHKLRKQAGKQIDTRVRVCE